MSKYIMLYLFSMIFILSFIALGYYHEEAHVQIFKHYGINSHIIIDGWNLETVPDSSCPNDYCTLSNNINEAVSYPIFVLFAMLGLGIICIIAQLIINKDNKEVQKDGDNRKRNTRGGRK